MSSMTITSMLQQVLESSPQRLVFEQAELRLTGLELDQLSSRCAFQLDALGVKPQSNVGLLLARGIHASIAIYGILKLAASYVPIDMQSPASRQRFIINDAACSCIIGQGSCPEWVRNLDVEYLDINDLFKAKEELPPLTRFDDELIAAILYTSGSTGTPKGVAVSHRAMLSFVQWTANEFSINSEDKIANLTPFHFDLSLFDLFTGPLCGATTVFIPEKLKMAPSKLTDWLIENKISCWYTVPSILNFLLFKGGLGDKKLNDLKLVLFAGEVFATSKLKQLCTLLPDTRFYNLFGPTETNVCLHWPVDLQALNMDKAIPIGKAACGAQLKVSSENQELLVKGPCLMSGYWINQQANLPLDDQGWFHTGDKVSIDNEGNYDYHGRLDRMIKSAGYRIEPEEIETALSAVPGVSGAAVIGLADPITGTKIVAAIVGEAIDQSQLRKQMANKLPAYMQPGFYYFLEKLPILSNGKTDYHMITQIIKTRVSR